MVTPSYKEFEHVLKLINKSRPDVIPYLLKSISNKVVRSLIEIAYNLLRGNIPITDKQIIKLKKNKKELKILINKRNSINKKRKILQENTDLVQNMLRIMFE